MQPGSDTVTVQEILAELDPLGRALWDAAMARAMNLKLHARIAELEKASLEDALTEAPLVS